MRNKDGRRLPVLTFISEDVMAKNFKMLTAERRNASICIQLQGDFDGSSAHELADVLDFYGRRFPRVTVDTSGLRDLNAFGLKLFITKLKTFCRSPSRFVFTGRFKNKFAQE